MGGATFCQDGRICGIWVGRYLILSKLFVILFIQSIIREYDLMSVRSFFISGALSIGVVLATSGIANAGCVSKSASATAPTESSAKWFAMETMVQAVSWGLWPGWVATGDVAGYTVKNEKYKCTAATGGYTCISWAKFCKK